MAECYYFDGAGYCLMNTTTPDGSQVDQNGAWIVDGVVQKRGIAAESSPVTLPDKVLSKLSLVTSYIYDSKAICSSMGYTYYAYDMNVTSSTMTSDEKAYVLYAYQYNSMNDSRIASSVYYQNNYYNRAKKSDMRAIMSELFGSASTSDMRKFAKSWALKEDNDYYYMECTGDFGDVNPAYLSTENIKTYKENGRIKLTGNVVQYNQQTGRHEPVKTFQAYFVPYSKSTIGIYSFDQLIVQ